MPAGGVNLRYTILGLLAQQPMTGYDVKRLFKGLSWLVGSPSPGSLYPILGALLEEGLATRETVPSADRPARKVYSITERGRQEVQRWIDQPVPPDASLKAFVRHLLLSGVLPRAKLLAHLRQRRSQVSAHYTALEQAVETLGDDADLGQSLALRYGLALAAAELNWLDEADARLLEQASLDAEGQQGDPGRGH
jgi:PadR family transcriptional regulator AphA